MATWPIHFFQIIQELDEVTLFLQDIFERKKKRNSSQISIISNFQLHTTWTRGGAGPQAGVVLRQDQIPPGANEDKNWDTPHPPLLPTPWSASQRSPHIIYIYCLSYYWKEKGTRCVLCKSRRGTASLLSLLRPQRAGSPSPLLILTLKTSPICRVRKSSNVGELCLMKFVVV